MTTTQNSIPKEQLDKAHKLLWWSGYKQLKVLVENHHLKNPMYTGIEVHANAIAIDVHVENIKSLLAGMGFTIRKGKEQILIT